MVLGSAAWAPTSETLAMLVMHLERTHHGLRQVMMPDGTSARVERMPQNDDVLHGAVPLAMRRAARRDSDLS